MAKKQISIFFCRRCCLPFQCRIDLVRHKRIHLNECRFTCHVCRKTFSRRESLKCHAMVHPCRKQSSPSLSHGSDYAAKSILNANADFSQEPLVKNILKTSRGNLAACERAPVETENRPTRSTLASVSDKNFYDQFQIQKPQTPKVNRNSEVISHQVSVKIKVLCPSAKRNIRNTKSALQGYIKNSSVHGESADRATTAASHYKSTTPLTTTNRETKKIKCTGRQGPLSRPLQLPFVRLIRHSFSSPEKIRDFVNRECALGKGSSFHRETAPLSTQLDQDTGKIGVTMKLSPRRPIQQPFVRLIRHSFSSPEKIRDFVMRECALAKDSSRPENSGKKLLDITTEAKKEVHEELS